MIAIKVGSTAGAIMTDREKINKRFTRDLVKAGFTVSQTIGGPMVIVDVPEEVAAHTTVPTKSCLTEEGFIVCPK